MVLAQINLGNSIYVAGVVLAGVLGLVAGLIAGTLLTPERARAIRPLPVVLVGVTLVPALLGWEDLLDFVASPGAAFCLAVGLALLIRPQARPAAAWLIGGAVITFVLCAYGYTSVPPRRPLDRAQPSRQLDAIHAKPGAVAGPLPPRPRQLQHRRIVT